MKLFCARLRATLGASVLAASAVVSVAAVPWSDTRAQSATPSIDFHLISSGASEMHNSCFRLSGTIGQAAPGFSGSISSPSYSVYAGFWVAAPLTGLDEIFFNGFEGC